MNFKLAGSALFLFCILFAGMSVPVYAQAGQDDAVMAYAQGMNDLSVKVVAVIYNYAGMVWESYDGGTLDSENAQLELDYVENILTGASDTISTIVDTVDESSPVYHILAPHLDCYTYFGDYMIALRTYFGDPTDDNLNAVYDARTAVEPYMKAIGLNIGARGEV